MTEEERLLQQLNNPRQGRDFASRGYGLIEDSVAAIPAVVGLAGKGVPDRLYLGAARAFIVAGHHAPLAPLFVLLVLFLADLAPPFSFFIHLGLLPLTGLLHATSAALLLLLIALNGHELYSLIYITSHWGETFLGAPSAPPINWASRVLFFGPGRNLSFIGLGSQKVRATVGNGVPGRGRSPRLFRIRNRFQSALIGRQNDPDMICPGGIGTFAH